MDNIEIHLGRLVLEKARRLLTYFLLGADDCVTRSLSGYGSMSRSEAEGGENKLCTTTLGLFVGGE